MAALIDVFYQAEGVDVVGQLEVEAETTFKVLKALLADKHGFSAEVVLLFVEDRKEPVPEDALLKEYAELKVLKVHVHRLREVKVEVVFNGKPEENHFPPSATVARVKVWAAEKAFGLDGAEVGEHVLQIVGTDVRPPPTTHIGTLLDEKTSVLAFDLVPHERVQGQSASDD